MRGVCPPTIRHSRDLPRHSRASWNPEECVMTNDAVIVPFDEMAKRGLNAQVINLPIHEYQHSNGKNAYGDYKRRTSKQFQRE